MRNKREGYCYKCGQIVKVGEGFFERRRGTWLVKHAIGTVEESKRCKRRRMDFID